MFPLKHTWFKWSATVNCKLRSSEPALWLHYQLIIQKSHVIRNDTMWSAEAQAVIVCVLCWQYTAADTSWESIAATCGPKSSLARGRCRCDAGGPSKRGTASYRESSSSPCPAPTRSPGQCWQRELPLGFKLYYFVRLRFFFFDTTLQNQNS